MGDKDDGPLTDAGATQRLEQVAGAGVEEAPAALRRTGRAPVRQRRRVVDGQDAQAGHVARQPVARPTAAGAGHRVALTPRPENTCSRFHVAEYWRVFSFLLPSNSTRNIAKDRLRLK